MIQNLLSKLPFLSDDKAEEVELSEEELRKQRIAFHRERVSNGPVKFSSPTSGQIRRFGHRELARKTKAARRRQIREHFAQKTEVAVLRAHLQAAGLIVYPTGHTPGAGDVLNAFTWIISHFADDKHADENGRVEVTREVVVSSLQAALNRYQHLTGRPQTAISPSYVLPVEVAA